MKENRIIRKKTKEYDRIVNTYENMEDGDPYNLPKFTKLSLAGLIGTIVTAFLARIVMLNMNARHRYRDKIDADLTDSSSDLYQANEGFMDNVSGFFAKYNIDTSGLNIDNLGSKLGEIYDSCHTVVRGLMGAGVKVKDGYEDFYIDYTNGAFKPIIDNADSIKESIVGVAMDYHLENELVDSLLQVSAVAGVMVGVLGVCFLKHYYTVKKDLKEIEKCAPRKKLDLSDKPKSDKEWDSKQQFKSNLYWHLERKYEEGPEK